MVFRPGIYEKVHTFLKICSQTPMIVEIEIIGMGTSPDWILLLSIYTEGDLMPSAGVEFKVVI